MNEVKAGAGTVLFVAHIVRIDEMWRYVIRTGQDCLPAILLICNVFNIVIMRNFIYYLKLYL